ncbi:DNA mismatch repair protein MutS [Epilithonimonas ginsengisoli]|uniref:DNA mismatch repair protein MutS n=1 Tax=Epilithonimonas ginsengisoli TaxID=1245592 RepID=A0ABU4JN38_9FLAO|nr:MULTISPECIES: MutS2/Smr-associated SH3 domain-containing protein [Chryseobacterium group]MBV6881755.1 DNA mismatch repair protein MutS [Epilithonimonas sp. FP105]MDW8551057.1 DNA mismatch repair protein MutS [Epilithonimonas ginsengisoli]OAH68224.1 DNA mismatch repair protein MutS [Chryseobacterium sp. FP211-J200]
MNINQADLNELEFPELLSEIAPFAFSPKTADKIMELRPMPIDEAEISLKKTSEFLSSFEGAAVVPFDEYEDIEEELKLMLIENFRLENKSFMRIKTMTEQIGKLQRFFPQLSEIFPTLLEEIKHLEFKKEIVDKIDKVFNRFGEVKTEASPILKTLRTEIQHARKAISENFNRALFNYGQSDFLDDIKESIIEDQRVLAVKSGFKKRVSGRVLGISKTGSITFIQPESVVKHYFKLKENQEEEKKEIDKILRKLTAEIAEFQPQLSDYQTYIFDLDLIRAKAKFAEQVNGILPKINRHQTLRLREAFHPLLWIRNKKEKKEIFSQTISLTEHNRIVCISGPNAGGKSITLKTVGLLQLMIQSGILVPCHPKSEMFFFEKIMTDIGDNQSIENHLSTYSSRLKKMSGMIKEADGKSLLLIDEFGTGSDPELGGALAESFLEFFYDKKSFGIITTHYTNIKLVVENLPAATNAAMLFDENSLEPLYKLEVGQAGSSFTFEVAEKNRIPRFIINSAKKKVEHDIVNLDKTIVKLQQEKFAVEKIKSDLSEKRDSVEDKRDNLQKLNEQLQQKLHNFQKLYEDEHRKLQFGNKIESFIDSYVKGKSRKDVVKDFVKILEQEKFRKIGVDKDESKRLQVIKRKITQQLKKEDVQEKIVETNEKLEEKRVAERAIWMKVGQRVRIKGSTSVGTIEEIKKSKVTVNYGTFKTTIDSGELERI